jgi:hypothetical protein
MWSTARAATNNVKEHWRTVCVLVSLTLFSLHILSASYHDYREIRGQVRWRPINGDRVTATEQRFGQAKRELTGTDLVGYFQAQSGPNRPWEDSEPFFIAQYALVPHVLVWDGRQKLNILATDNRVQVFRAHESLPTSRNH